MNIFKNKSSPAVNLLFIASFILFYHLQTNAANSMSMNPGHRHGPMDQTGKNKIKAKSLDWVPHELLFSLSDPGTQDEAFLDMHQTPLNNAAAAHEQQSVVVLVEGSGGGNGGHHDGREEHAAAADDDDGDDDDAVAMASRYNSDHETLFFSLLRNNDQSKTDSWFKREQESALENDKNDEPHERVSSSCEPMIQVYPELCQRIIDYNVTMRPNIFGHYRQEHSYESVN